MKEGMLMTKDILYKSDALYGLFTQKDFEFLQKSNSNQEELEFQIKMADLKKDKIIEYINEIDINNNSLENLNTEKLKKYVDNAESAFDSINHIIKNLTTLQDEFDNIEKDILNLVISKESNNAINTSTNIDSINKKIYNFKENQKKLENENKKYYIIVEKFLDNSKKDNDFNTQVEIKTNNTNIKLDQNNSNKLDQDLKDNLVLTISEKQNRVYLPYTKSEIQELLENYPDDYKNAKDVIEQEFIADISIYNKHPVLARFREAYSLSRHKEMKTAIDSLKFAMDLMFRSDINPTIIAAVKSQKQLEDYIKHLESNTLDMFPHFTIIFEVNPMI
jgi:hypothetical protein